MSNKWLILIITSPTDLRKYIIKHVAQQWELGQLGQGKGVARGNPDNLWMIIQVIGRAFTNLTAYCTQLCLQKQFGCQDFCHSTQNCIQLNHHIHSTHHNKLVTTNIKSVKTHNNYTVTLYRS